MKTSKTKLTSALATTLVLCFSQTVAANVMVRFVESAPKDWFSLTNSGECLLEDIVLTVDLTQSAGKLIFDTTAAGEGVEVFQPFEKREGEIALISSSEVNDGDNALSVRIEQLAPGQSASFTIDVDDTLTQSQLGNIRVSDAEIKGGTVLITFDSATQVNGKFNDKGEIVLASPDC